MLQQMRGELQEAHDLMRSLTDGYNVNGFEYMAQVSLRDGTILDATWLAVLHLTCAKSLDG